MTSNDDRTIVAARRARRWMGAAVLGAGLVAAACSAEAGRDEYTADGDSGAAAPATVPDANTARAIGVDSTSGVGGRTGRPGMAGDSLGARTRANPDSANRVPPPPPR